MLKSPFNNKLLQELGDMRDKNLIDFHNAMKKVSPEQRKMLMGALEYAKKGDINAVKNIIQKVINAS